MTTTSSRESAVVPEADQLVERRGDRHRQTDAERVRRHQVDLAGTGAREHEEIAVARLSASRHRHAPGRGAGHHADQVGVLRVDEDSLVGEDEDLRQARPVVVHAVDLEHRRRERQRQERRERLPVPHHAEKACPGRRDHHAVPSAGVHHPELVPRRELRLVQRGDGEGRNGTGEAGHQVEIGRARREHRVLVAPGRARQDRDARDLVRHRDRHVDRADVVPDEQRVVAERDQVDAGVVGQARGVHLVQRGGRQPRRPRHPVLPDRDRRVGRVAREDQREERGGRDGHESLLSSIPWRG